MDPRIDNLIIGYLEKTLNEKELEEFFLWIDADTENKKRYFEIKASYDSKRSRVKDIDIDSSWMRFINKTNSKRNSKSLKKILSYAAVALVSILCTVSFLQIFQPKESKILTQYIGGNGIESDKLILPDGTQISVGANTVVGYDNDYGRTERRVFLTGEAFFEVAPNKKIPFIVDVREQNIQALGTKFNVLAYPSDSIIVTTLLEGSVKITTDNFAEPIVLYPDQQLVYNNSSRSHLLRSVEAELYTSWINGYYYFKGQSLDEIIKKLSCIYGITYEIHSEKTRNTIFTGIFYKGQSIKEIMEIINVSVPLKYRMVNNHLTIS